MAVLLGFTICVIFALTSLISTQGSHQQPLGTIESEGGDKFDLIYELKKAEIIPTVLSAFFPLLTVSIAWSNATANYGNTVNPSVTQDMPSIQLLDTVPGGLTKDPTPQLTLAMTDPDAPSRDNPKWSEICHWIATEVQLSEPDDDHVSRSKPKSQFSKSFKEIMPYKPPGPPPKTGKHRYVFVALAPKNRTMDSLYLRKPGGRQHWGYESERDGLRMWAEEMGLGVVGANFIYEQNDEQ